METNGVRASSVSSEQSLLSGHKLKKAGEKPVKLRFKKLPVQVKKAEVNGTKDGEASSTSSSPVAPQFDGETMANFPNGKQEPLDMLTCKHCKKNILKRTAKEHVAGCLKSKQEKARKKKEAREAAQRAKEKAERGDDDEEDEVDITDGKAKKRKAGDEEDSKDSKKKKNKKEDKPKQAKTKGPVDVEKQCGVVLSNGQQCARSLTCKSHSMGAKRAVPGRSLRYDTLLQAYQKKNQARQQKAAFDANAPVPDEDFEAAFAGPVDSDEERDAVMSAISRSLARPQPLVTHTLFPTRRKYQLIRMKEMLSNALSGNRSGNLFAVPAEAKTSYPASATDGTFVVPHPPTQSPALTGIGVAQPGMKASARKATMEVT